MELISLIRSTNLLNTSAEELFLQKLHDLLMGKNKLSIEESTSSSSVSSVLYPSFTSSCCKMLSTLKTPSLLHSESAIVLWHMLFCATECILSQGASGNQMNYSVFDLNQLNMSGINDSSNAITTAKHMVVQLLLLSRDQPTDKLIRRFELRAMCLLWLLKQTSFENTLLEELNSHICGAKHEISRIKTQMSQLSMFIRALLSAVLEPPIKWKHNLDISIEQTKDVQFQLILSGFIQSFPLLLEYTLLDQEYDWFNLLGSTIKEVEEHCESKDSKADSINLLIRISECVELLDAIGHKNKPISAIDILCESIGSIDSIMLIESSLFFLAEKMKIGFSCGVLAFYVLTRSILRHVQKEVELNSQKQLECAYRRISILSLLVLRPSIIESTSVSCALDQKLSMGTIDSNVTGLQDGYTESFYSALGLNIQDCYFVARMTAFELLTRIEIESVTDSNVSSEAAESIIELTNRCSLDPNELLQVCALQFRQDLVFGVPSNALVAHLRLIHKLFAVAPLDLRVRICTDLLCCIDDYSIDVTAVVCQIVRLSLTFLNFPSDLLVCQHIFQQCCNLKETQSQESKMDDPRPFPIQHTFQCQNFLYSLTPHSNEKCYWAINSLALNYLFSKLPELFKNTTTKKESKCHTLPDCDGQNDIEELVINEFDRFILNTFCVGIACLTKGPFHRPSFLKMFQCTHKVLSSILCLLKHMKDHERLSKCNTTHTDEQKEDQNKLTEMKVNCFIHESGSSMFPPLISLLRHIFEFICCTDRFESTLQTWVSKYIYR